MSPCGWQGQERGNALDNCKRGGGENKASHDEHEPGKVVDLLGTNGRDQAIQGVVVADIAA